MLFSPFHVHAILKFAPALSQKLEEMRLVRLSAALPQKPVL